MRINVTIDTNEALNANDRAILLALAGGGAPPSASETDAGTQAPRKARKAPETPSEPTETPSEPTETPSEADEALDQDLLAEAIAKGTALVKAKKGARLKEVLEQIGYPSVSKIDSNQGLRDFLKAID